MAAIRDPTSKRARIGNPRASAPEFEGGADVLAGWAGLLGIIVQVRVRQPGRKVGLVIKKGVLNCAVRVSSTRLRIIYSLEVFKN